MSYRVLGININNGITFARIRNEEPELLCNLLCADTQEIVNGYVGVELLIRQKFVTPVDENRNNDYNYIEPFVGHTSNEPFKIWWDKSTSNFIRARNKEYLRHYGPKKLFLSKKSIWVQIAIDLYSERDINIGWKEVRIGYNLLTHKG